jgi:hypothetical protein
VSSCLLSYSPGFLGAGSTVVTHNHYSGVEEGLNQVQKSLAKDLNADVSPYHTTQTGAGKQLHSSQDVTTELKISCDRLSETSFMVKWVVWVVSF